MGRKVVFKEISYKLFGSVVNLLLWNVYLIGSSVGKSGSRGVCEAFAEADQELEKVNFRTIQAALSKLTKKGLVSYQKRDNLYDISITEFGRKRLENLFPSYHTRRPWDGKMYLVIYDIPEINSKKRDLLRYFLKQLNCKMVQESVWLTPYNPRELISGFVKKHGNFGMVLVSDIGKDGGIGESSIQDLVLQLYNLDDLNDRYEAFLQNVKKKVKSQRLLFLEYVSILKDDPQLPFEILPKRFLGQKAYEMCLKLTNVPIPFSAAK